jgi:hypothetical protein
VTASKSIQTPTPGPDRADASAASLARLKLALVADDRAWRLERAQHIQNTSLFSTRLPRLSCRHARLVRLANAPVAPTRLPARHDSVDTCPPCQRACLSDTPDALISRTRLPRRRARSLAAPKRLPRPLSRRASLIDADAPVSPPC